MGEIDDLLASLKAEYEGKTSPTPAKVDREIDRPRAEVKTDPPPVPPSTSDPILQELQREYREREMREAIEREKERVLREQRKRAALQERAKKWLETLDPKSEEGRWFEEFSYSHESRLEAATIYLDALREVDG
ncbi:hypothetical protein V0288_02620 [Pannus brasiliensis CCIBt3594]|uniref:Clathrin light chain n=1 Tax=Pannus brasiliensis CCIBt3594 TaxID=1427578 RepID=A0AAW9QMN6_9CHRO